ncbi:2-succinyl-6-hydroxy-2,4-cyclohexadiene-1-carboxylate synthase [Streptomyces antimycoticus]
MRFSIFHNLGAPGRLGEYADVMAEAREFAVTADRAGFWSTWYTEHHFGHEAIEITPNPVLMGADIAARTTDIRIGQAASIATFWHPLRLAEDIAMLDQLSGGRVEVGLGRGLYGREALNLNALADPRDQEQNRALYDRRMWDRCLPALAARHRVTLIDLRGHGASPAAAAGVSLAELAADVGALLSGPTHVVGFSLGALVAQRLGLDRPDLTASLTLVSSVAGRSEEERAAVARRQKLAAEDFGASAWAAVDRWFSPAWRAQDPALAQRVLDTLLANDRASYLACYRVFATADTGLWRWLPRIAAPTVAVTGERDPGSTPAMSHRLAGRIPGGLGGDRRSGRRGGPGRRRRAIRVAGPRVPRSDRGGRGQQQAGGALPHPDEPVGLRPAGAHLAVPARPAGRVHGEHHRVLNLIQAKDGDGAERATREHVRMSHQALMAGMDERRA